MTGPLIRLAGLWVRRYAETDQTVAAARDTVGHLKPITVVTGGSRGIGAALAMRFADAGHDVAIVGRNSAALHETAAGIEAQTGRSIVRLVCDLTDAAAPATIDGELASLGFYQDILVNNAAIGLSGPFDGHTAAAVDGLIAINIAAPTRLMLHAVKSMHARQRGGILNIASLGAYVPGPNQAAYYASKAYILSLTEAVAAETAGQGLRIAVVAPGPVNTGFHTAMDAEGARYRRYLPALSPDRTARICYRGFMLGRRLIIPGVFNTLMFIGLRLLPHPITVPITGWLLGWPKHK